MKTILKIPIYLEIETGNIDRMKVTRAMQGIIIPEYVKAFAHFGEQCKYTVQEQETLQKLIGPFSTRVLTDIEILKKPDSNVSSHTKLTLDELNIRFKK